MKDLEQRTSKMKKILLLTLGCLTMISAASAQTRAQKAVDKKLAKYNQTGEFVNCIRRNMIKKMVVVDDTKILFELKGNKAMLNTLDKKCTGLDEEEIREHLLPPEDIWLSAKEAKKLGICDQVKSVY